MTPNGFTRFDAERVARFVQSRERRRAKPGVTNHLPPKLGGVRVLLCTSEPNIEAIDNGGDWPETINAKLLKASDGFDFTAIKGRCEESGGDGGGGGNVGCGCDPRSPCSKESRIRFVWGLGASLFGAVEGTDAVTLSYVRSEFPDGCERWIFQSDDGEWEAHLDVHTFGGEYPYCVDDCYGLASLQWFNPPDGSPNAIWGLVGVLGDLLGTWYCNPICSQGAVFDNTPSVGEAPSVLRMYWEGGIGSGASADSTSGTGGTGTDENEDDGDIVVQLHRFISGVPLFGEAFVGINLGGQWYAYGMHHTGVAGNLTTRVLPRTVLMDRCEYEIPFIYTIRDPQAAEGTRHLLAWCAAKKKYVMVAMGDCQ